MSLLPAAKIKCIDWDKTLGPEVDTHVVESCWGGVCLGRGVPRQPLALGSLPPAGWP